MLANNPDVLLAAETAIEEMLNADGGERFRRGIRPKDLAQFFISTSISMLLGVIPGTDNPDVARRYIDVFMLPALVADPPPPRTVFPD
jgi:hypothetical protein